MSEVTLEQLNRMSAEQFVKHLGDLFESSPWVAEQAVNRRPFQSRAQLIRAMKAAVWNAPRKQQLELLRAHPELGNRGEMTEPSQQEQASAGLDRLDSRTHQRFQALNRMYRETFGFPFIMAVSGRSSQAIQRAMEKRLDHSPAEEFETALAEVCKIARLRLDQRLALETDTTGEAAASSERRDRPGWEDRGGEEAVDERTMYYGKEKVAVYRTYAAPLKGIRPIPESNFQGRDNIVFAMDVRVQVEGDAFFPSFSEGDNEMVVATDSMKNFILHQAGEYRGATQEGFLYFTGSRFLETYAQMSGVRMSARAFPFDPRLVPDSNGFKASDLVFRPSQNEAAFAEIYAVRSSGKPVLHEQRSGVSGLQLIKLKGSSFYGYVQDEYTTLPEERDRALFIELDIFWQYADAQEALGEKPEAYVPAEQVRDLAQTVFHETYSASIQDLIYTIGQRLLRRFPQLESLRFEAKNRTWIKVRDDLAGTDEGKVYTEPPRPTGFQIFSMDRGDLDGKEPEPGEAGDAM